MSSLINEFINKSEFESYEDFKENFKFKIPNNFNFAYDVVDRYGKEDPEKIALVWCNDEEEKTFTFKDMQNYSSKVANFLKRSGIKKGDRVMLTLKSRYEFWFTLLALHKIGAISIPATHMLKPHDIEYRIKKAKLKMIICTSENDVPKNFEKAEKNVNKELIKVVIGEYDNQNWYNFYDEINKESEKFKRPIREEATQNDDTSLVYFSSGTVGMPKMIKHDYLYPIAHILTAKYWQNVQENGLHYTIADTGWAKAVWGQIYGQWICGSGVFVYAYDRFDAKKTLAKTSTHNVTTFCAPPTIYRFLIKEDLSQYNLSHIKYAVTAGEPLNPEVYNKFYELTGLKLKEGFGQTECIIMTAAFPWITPKPGSMGKINATFDIKLIDKDGEEVDIGEEGEIVINTKKGKPVGLFTGYYLDPEKTKKVWYDDYYHTQDTAWKDEDDYLWFIGRTDDMIKSSGYRIGPFEVENVVMTHPAVLECAVTGHSDPDRGQVVKATITLVEGYEANDDLKKEIQDHVKKHTAPYKYPRIVEFVDELPKTISGKIKRSKIREK